MNPSKMKITAIVRDVSAALARCELSFVSREPIDLERARLQHAAYVQALAELGCEVITLAAQDALPDSVFVEDVAIVFDEVAVMTRPGAASRREEGATVATALAPHRPLLHIEAPGTLDGGDVLRCGRHVFVGRSARSNAEGIEQLRRLVNDFGYRVDAVDMHDCLHLKSAVTAVAAGVLLINRDWVDAHVFADFQLIDVANDEPHAANALLIEVNGQTGVVYPDCFPQTLARLRAAGIAVSTIDLSELQKAEGAVTCCSLLLRTGST
ncbi:MAG: dimethylarginine dimethylaminohydrolase family protein [Pseudomarimonas sp.]